MVGGDGRWIYARDHENAFAGTTTRERRIPGEQAFGGGFFQDVWSPWWRFNVVAGARVDYWRNYGASRTETVLPANTTTVMPLDRKSTRLNSSHGYISYAVFCLKK